MFRKIVTELAYSPTLVGDLGHYVKQLRKEASKRQIGLIFTFLAVIIQIIAVAFPPESANAHNPGAFIDGGVQSIQDYLGYYDQNTRNVKDLLTSLGITRSEIEGAKLANLASTPTASFWSLGNTRTKESTAYFFGTTNEKSGVAYHQPLSGELTGSEAYVSASLALGGWFAITKDGANLVTEPPVLSNCEAWLTSPGDILQINSWTTDTRCLSILDPSLTARVISSSSPAIDQLQALDRIAYTLSISNNSDTSIPLAPAINLEDTLEYSRILDYGGGDYNYDTKNLTWKTTTLPARGNFERTFIIQLLPSIPATAKSQFITASYDCTISASFGNVLSTPIDCPPAKRIEQITNSLPPLSTRFNIITAILLLTIVSFLYARSHQLLSEIYVIRHNHLGGL